MIIFYYLLFFLAAFCSFYIPGKFCIDRLKLQISFVERITLNWLFGICLFIFITYLLSWVGLAFIYLGIIIVVSLYYFYTIASRRTKLFENIKNSDWISLSIVIVGSFSFLGLMFFSGWETPTGIQFIGTNATDGVRHLAYIKNLIDTFPPQHPVLAGTPLRGFHYFYDFLLGKFASFFPFTIRDLYFRLFPLLISLLYGAGFYVFTSYMTNTKKVRRFVLFFAYFSQSSAFIFLFFNRTIDITASALVQPIGLIVNPFTVFSLPILLLGIAYIPKIRDNKKYIPLVALFLGILSEIKIYCGLIGIAALVFYVVLVILKEKKINWNYVITLVVTACITIITYFPNNLGAGGLVFAPLLFYRHYMEQDLFNSWHWEIKRTIYSEHHNYIRIILLYGEAFGVFWLLSLGSQLLMLFGIPQIIRRKFWQQQYNLLILVMIIVPIVIGSLFIQTVSPFDTVQFFWIMMSLLSIPAGIVVGMLLEKRGKITQIVITVFIIVCSVPGFLAIEYQYLHPTNPLLISHQEVNILDTVKTIVPSTSFIVYIPPPSELQEGSFYQGTPVISAISGRSVYVDTGGLPNDDIAEYNYREKNIIALHKALRDCDWGGVLTSLKTIGSPYILTNNTYRCFSNANTSFQLETKSLKFYKIRLQ